MFELYKKENTNLILVDSFQSIEECHARAAFEAIEFYSIEFRSNGLSRIFFATETVPEVTIQETLEE